MFESGEVEDLADHEQSKEDLENPPLKKKDTRSCRVQVRCNHHNVFL